MRTYTVALLFAAIILIAQAQESYSGSGYSGSGYSGSGYSGSGYSGSGYSGSGYSGSGYSGSGYSGSGYSGYDEYSGASSGGYKGKNRDGFSHNKGHKEDYDPDFNEEQILNMVIFCFLIGAAIAVIIAAVLVFKCMKRRSTSNQIKEQMHIRKVQYASAIGMNLFQINNRIPPTIHL